MIAGSALLTVIIGAATVLASRHDRADPTSRIAVLPLVPTTHDTALARIGRDIVVTLSSDLDGVRRMYTVDALTVLAQTVVLGRWRCNRASSSLDCWAPRAWSMVSSRGTARTCGSTWDCSAPTMERR